MITMCVYTHHHNEHNDNNHKPPATGHQPRATNTCTKRAPEAGCFCRCWVCVQCFVAAAECSCFVLVT